MPKPQSTDPHTTPMLRETAPARERASATIAPTLVEFIRSGRWRPGRKLPSEQALCLEYKVSRTAVRESMRYLRGSGLIETRNGCGSFVAAGQVSQVRDALVTYARLTLDRSAARELIQLRVALEGEAAAFLAAHPGEASRLIQRMREMEREVDLHRFADADINFHMDLLEATGNRLIAELGHSMRERYERFAVSSYLDNLPLRSETLLEHGRIVERICGGDAQGARDAARQHVYRACDRWEQLHPTL